MHIWNDQPQTSTEKYYDGLSPNQRDSLISIFIKNNVGIEKFPEQIPETMHDDAKIQEMRRNFLAQNRQISNKYPSEFGCLAFVRVEPRESLAKNEMKFRPAVYVGVKSGGWLFIVPEGNKPGEFREVSSGSAKFTDIFVAAIEDLRQSEVRVNVDKLALLKEKQQKHSTEPDFPNTADKEINLAQLTDSQDPTINDITVLEN